MDDRKTNADEGAVRVYLAGPEVFSANAAEIIRAKKRLCAERGLIGVAPSDGQLPTCGDSREVGLAISAENERLMRSCHVAVANLTPFRSPSADSGTVYETGFMRGSGKPVFAYTNGTGRFHERTVESLGGGIRLRADGTKEDLDGMAVEDFGLTDNLMLDGAIAGSGSILFVVGGPEENRFERLEGFEACLEEVVRWFQRRLVLTVEEPQKRLP